MSSKTRQTVLKRRQTVMARKLQSKNRANKKHQTRLPYGPTYASPVLSVFQYAYGLIFWTICQTVYLLFSTVCRSRLRQYIIHDSLAQHSSDLYQPILIQQRRFLGSEECQAVTFARFQRLFFLFFSMCTLQQIQSQSQALSDKRQF